MFECCSRASEFHGCLGLLLHRSFRAHFSGMLRTALSAHGAPAQAGSSLLPLPWLAAELGWIVAEYGRQPWAIDGVSPNPQHFQYVVFTLAGFVLFYSSLLVVDIILMAKYIRMGPAKASALEVSLLFKVDDAGAGERVNHDHPVDYEVLRVIRWLFLGVLLIGFCGHRWLRSRSGNASALCAATPYRTSRHDQCHRAILGWQSGVLIARRWRDSSRPGPADLRCGLFLILDRSCFSCSLL